MQQQNLKKVQPLLSRVLIQKLVPPKKSNSGLLLPDSKTSSNIGKVVAVGAGKVLENGKILAVNVKVGDFVLLPDYGGIKVPKTNDSEDLLLYHSEDILAIVEGDFNTKI